MNETPSTPGADTAPSAGAEKPVSIRKRSREGGASPVGERPAKEPPVHVAPPLTINLATAALLAMVVGNVARWLFLLGNTPTLDTFVRDANDKAKKPDASFTPSEVADAVHRVRQGAMINAAIFGVALLLLAYAIRRTRSASGTRWAVLIIFVYTLMPLYIIPTKGLPAAAKAAGVLVGAASIAAILLIFIPRQSQKYFRECREANMPEGMRGKPRSGLGALFGPKGPRGQAPVRGGARGGLFGGARNAPAGPATAPAGATPRPTSAKAKAKVRSDSDAIAKGAELARSRAKASKSRRTAE